MIIQKLLLLSLCVVTNADESRLIDYALDDLVNQAYEAMHRAEILKKQHGSISNSLAVDAAALWYKNARDASQLELSVLQPTGGPEIKYRPRFTRSSSCDPHNLHPVRGIVLKF